MTDLKSIKQEKKDELIGMTVLECKTRYHDFDEHGYSVFTKFKLEFCKDCLSIFDKKDLRKIHSEKFVCKFCDVVIVK